MDTAQPCELCEGQGGTLIFRAERWRVLRVTGAEGDTYPGFCRVVWNAHVREMTDLDEGARTEFMDAVYRVEKALRGALQPHKINLASLGNLTPHLHWHVIPRYLGDAAFPRPIWAVTLPATQGGTPLGTLDHRPDVDAAQTEREHHWETAVRHALETR